MGLLEFGKQLLAGKVDNDLDSLKMLYAKASTLFLIDFIYWIAMFEKNLTLFYEPQSHPDWVLIHQNIEKVILGPDEEVIASYQNCSDAIAILISGVSKTENIDTAWKRKLSLIGKNSYYLLRKNKKQI